MKKGLWESIFAFAIIGIFAFNFVSAETNFDIWGRNTAQFISAPLDSLGIDPEGLTPLLLGLLLFIIIYSIVSELFSFKGRWAWVGSGGVSLIVVLLTFIYLPKNFAEAIALQYGAAGAAILAAVPLIILLYFTVVVVKSKFVAVCTWIFYVVYYFALFIAKIANSPAGTGTFSADNLPYIAAIIAGIAILITIAFWRERVFFAKLSSDEEKAMRDVKLREAGRKVEREEAESRGINAS